MTAATITAENDAKQATALGAALPEGVEFVWADPGTLILDANVRTTVDLDTEFLDSIRDLGVLVPVVAIRTPEGLAVQKGQRRTLGAVEVGRTGIPVYIVPDGGDVERIIGQLAENQRRAAMTQTDTASAYEQLSLLGLSAAKIARRTQTTTAQVKAGLTVAKSTAAAEAAGLYALDLVSAAMFAEFDGDEDATETLRHTAERGGSLAHAAQRIRDERARTRAIATLKETLTTDGVTITHAPGYYSDGTKRAVAALRAKGSATPLTSEQHATCPQHVAWITYDETTATATAVYGCSNYKSAGHLRWTDPTEQTERTPLSDAERAERRQVRESNAAWRSAETVRRDWLPTLARRKTPPKGSAEFVARAVLHEGSTLATAAMNGHRLAAKILGHKDDRGTRDYVSGLLAKATTPRSQVIALVVVLAAIEEATSAQTWRHVYPDGTVARYLTALETWGYDLADIEHVTCGRTPDPAPEPDGQDAEPEPEVADAA